MIKNNECTVDLVPLQASDSVRIWKKHFISLSSCFDTRWPEFYAISTVHDPPSKNIYTHFNYALLYKP